MAVAQAPSEGFPTFKAFCRQMPSSQLNLIRKHGSQSMNRSTCMKQYTKIHLNGTTKALTKTLIIPPALIFLSTILLHRKRGFALTSGTVLRSLTLKYLPVMLVYGAYQFNQGSKFDAALLEQDFPEIEAEYNIIMQKYGQNFLNRLKAQQ